jgi:hypothetical protein
MKEQDGQGRPVGEPKSQSKSEPKEQAKTKGESELSKLLQEKGLFDKKYRLLADPVGYHTIERMDSIRARIFDDIGKERWRIDRGEPAEALINKWRSWNHTIQNLKMVYGIIVYLSCKDKQDKRMRKNLLRKT